MVSYRLDGVTQSHALGTTRSRMPASATIADYISGAGLTINEYQHPVAVFDATGQPAFRNAALAAKLAAGQESQESDGLWQMAYAAACRIAAEAIVNRSVISTVIPVRQHSFAVLGSLLRQPSGNVMGAIMHLAEVSRPGICTDRESSELSCQEPGARSDDTEAYRVWISRRNKARARMQRLSPRESEVVARVSDGMPNKSIACELEISVKTIEKHRANAARKLGVTSTPEMVRIAVLADTGTGTSPDDTTSVLTRTI